MAYVLTSISGNLISAASAGYAPTNSADVSAIASGYQVVSSTSTQLYAGTAFLTSVNDAPVSASRAGNAVNAGMANSAYYDGTGRLISSLPDSAAVSSIASSYAESAASGKLDSSASSSFYTVDNPSGFITGVDLSEYATTGYVDSAVSGKADSSALSSYALSSDVSGVIDTVSGYSGNWFNTNITVALNSAKWNSAYDTVSTNSASWGGGTTGDYVEKSANNVAIGNPSPSASGTGFAHGFLVKAEDYSVALASFAVTATNTSFGQGYYVTATQSSFGQGVSSEAVDNSFAQGTQSTASARSFAQGYGDVARTCSFAQGYDNKASDYSFAQGRGNIARHSSTAFGQYNLHYDGDTATGNSAAFTIGDGAFGARHDLMLVTKDGEITMFSSTADTVGTGIMSSIRAISAAATGGGVDSATVSAIASSYAESAVSGKQDALEFAYDADSAISSINGSALAGQGGGASITAVSYDTATQQSSIVTATGFGIAGSATNYPRVSSVYLTDGQTRHIEANTLAPGAAQTSISYGYTLRFSPASSMWSTAGVAKGIYSPLQYGTGAGLFMDNGNFKGYLKGNELFVCNTAAGRAARLEVHQSRGSRLGLTGNTGNSTVNLTESELTIVNSGLSTATLGRTKLVFQSPDSGTATFSHNYIKLYDTAESAAKTISSTSIDYWNGKADSSAMTSYALSADVSGTVDLVSTQSANWGGSALALSAGPGVKLEKVGDTLVASTDETVLWSGSGYSVGDTMQTYNLSGNPSDFEEIQVYGHRPLGATDTMGAFDFRFQPAFLTANSVSKICVPLAFVAGGSVTPYIGAYSVNDINTTSWHDGFTWQYQPTTTYQGTSYIAHIHKIVGINRTAGV